MINNDLIAERCKDAAAVEGNQFSRYIVISDHCATQLCKMLDEMCEPNTRYSIERRPYDLDLNGGGLLLKQSDSSNWIGITRPDNKQTKESLIIETTTQNVIGFDAYRLTTISGTAHNLKTALSSSPGHVIIQGDPEHPAHIGTKAKVIHDNELIDFNLTGI